MVSVYLMLSALIVLPAAAMLGPALARRADRRNIRTLEDGSTFLMPSRTSGDADGAVFFGGGGSGDAGCGSHGSDGGSCH